MAMFDEAKIEDTVRAELTDALYRQNAMTLAMGVLLSVYLWFALHETTSLALLTGWLVATNVIALGRLVLALAYRRLPPQRRSSHAWMTRFCVGTAAAGVMWGSLGTVLYPAEGLPHQLICVSALLAIAAVALFSLRVMFAAFAAMAVPTLLPASVYLTIVGNNVNQTLTGAILGLFLAAGLVMARRNAKDAAETLRLRYRLAAAVDAAEAASKAKGQFLATVSHEIRTPINGVLGIAHILLRTAQDAVTRRYLELLYSSGNHLLALINDILDFSKIEAGKLDLNVQDFDLPRAVREVTEILDQRAQEKGLRLLVHFSDDVPQYVRGDSVRLQQVLNNLIGNAIKFTEAGFVTLTIKRSEELVDPSAAEGAQALLFDVSDTGIGIAPNDQEHIFSAFSQADSSFSRKHGGTGLGLTISRQLVEAMGGHISLRSAPGRGSKFSFSARFAPASADYESGQAGNQHANSLVLVGNVLLVEDVELNRLIARSMLESLGLSVHSAPDGQIALTLAQREHFDAILMDVFLPVMDGLTATRAIRQDELAKGRARTPIIALTANASAEDRERCTQAGMDDYLTKPLRTDELQATLKKWLPGQPMLQERATAPARSGPEDDQVRKVASADTQRLAYQLARAVANGDMDAMATSAHSLKSVGAHLEARTLSQVCGALENAARAGNDVEVRGLVDDVSAACQDLLSKLAVSPAESLSVHTARQGIAETDRGTTEVNGCAKTALVVDDEPNDQFFLRRILESQGYRVRACWSGETAVSACNDERPDLIILDGRMPGMDGVDTCRAIRSICSGHIPIVVVTGVADPIWRAAAYEAGADKILDKDVSIETLRSNLISAIGSVRM